MLKIKEATLRLEDIEKVLFENEPIQLQDDLLKKVAESFQFLESFSKDKVIYGINTGLGPMAQYRVNEEDAKQLQLNLIRSHCAGTGRPLGPLETKACMLSRLNSLLQAKSGVHPSVVLLLQELINKDISPLIFEHGGVGASGDLVQLAHLALFLIGEGEGFYKGERLPASKIYALTQLKPIDIHIREGLAIMNGTSGMTGLGLVNIIHAKRVLEWSMTASGMINELVESFDDHFSEELNTAKRHPGQIKVASTIDKMLADSQLVKKRKDHLYVTRQEEVFKEKVQEYYSIRCTPQILGPIYDTLQQAEIVLLNELNSANDNPMIDVASQNVFHGGNFHGDYVSLEMDKLKIAITKLTMLAERQINYLFNHKLNEKFPPFLNMGVLGLNLGLQGMQFTATSTTAESQTLSFPMYLNSIPNNGDNQDIVSMGFNAALLLSKVLENAYQVLAIQMMALSQAFAISGQEHKLSSCGKKVLEQIRDIHTPSKADKPLYEPINDIRQQLSKGCPLDLLM
jgi:histidine ammonia-lyase